ncbi:putative bifunctional diguanylate cyclase/phosphodiesterase [Rhizomonospora bruguierae]|uniref:putative bifunctional diguanylate cyclase/phosphodiesterase n=1 Tax=Rhizomonospora bruguierae TaxID=1581705 RepID=UPI001BCB901E|nr:EAL domain-containing protein [Micromonospora sp. NBRC 107566]
MDLVHGVPLGPSRWPGSTLLAGYGLWMALLTVVMFALPRWQVVTWALIGLSAAAAVATGAWRNRPRLPLPWALMSAGLFAFIAGDTAYSVIEMLGRKNPFPSVADGIYLLVFAPLLVGSLLLLNRYAGSGMSRASTIEALILTAGLALLSWIYLVTPYVSDPRLTAGQKLISAAYPLIDVLNLAVILRLLTAVRVTPAVALLGLGGAGLLAADVVYAAGQLSGEWETGRLVDLLWIAFYAGVGAAALHPSMVELTDPRVVRVRELSRARLLALTASTLIAPALLGVQALRGEVRNGGVIALFSAAMFLLVLTRLSGVLAVHRQALSRERALRRAGAALLTSTDVEQVEAAVRDAVARLLPAHGGHRVHQLEVDQLGGAVPADAADAPHLVYTRALPAPLAAELAGFELALVCPQAGGGGPTGALLVAAAERDLTALQDALEVLAGQAALARHRIALTTEINRQRSEEYFRTLVHNTADVILILDEQDRIRYASPSAAAVFDAALVGRPVVDLVEAAGRVPAQEYLDTVRWTDPVSAAVSSGADPAEPAQRERQDWTMVRADGRKLQAEVSCRDLRADETVGGLVLTLHDVTERRSLERELVHRAFYDSLTGLANRALFAERLEQAVTRAGRTGAIVGVLFMDLDDFKVVNDTLGHEAGDRLLVAAARRLSAIVVPDGSVARLGGDEFAVLVEDVADPAAVERVAQRISEAFGEPFELGDRAVGGAVSVGVATTGEAIDSDDLLRQADLALYLAKADGKGGWRRFQTALHTAVRERMELRAALDRALAEDQFQVHYQPIVDLATGSPAGFEALLRWPHRDRGLVPPDQFIPIAEESGLIVPLGAWVLGQALDAAARWRDATGERVPYLSVNVSARQFRSPGFIDSVLGQLAERGLPAASLMLEITESLLLRDEDDVWTGLARLRERGVRIAIDDFGTGYSSLSYLRQVPADVLKIDKTFVDTMTTSVRQRALVEAIVSMAHTLGLSVVAEGVEQSQDRELLAAVGCEAGQGYLFARPMAYRDATRWLLDEQIAA